MYQLGESEIGTHLVQLVHIVGRGALTVEYESWSLEPQCLMFVGLEPRFTLVEPHAEVTMIENRELGAMFLGADTWSSGTWRWVSHDDAPSSKQLTT